MKLLNTSCKKATYLVSKKEEGKLTWLESIRLRSHLSICSLCRKFELQTAFIGRMAKEAAQQLSLPAESKNRIKQSLEEKRGIKE
jgi:predicted anti-sigma-YlaC factor YlaD